MSSPFVAEIRMFACNFAPTGWAQCNGQLLPISQNTALFSLLGTYYGGDGKSTFALPNLMDASPLADGQSTTGTQYFVGQMSGVSATRLIATEVPVHTHAPLATAVQGTRVAPGGASWGSRPAVRGAQDMYAASSSAQTWMHPGALSVTGESLPHNNMQPYVVLNFCIALQGVFPPRT